ncbi:type IV conjugative transfer system protein TraL, partial [Proteus mirabilis]
FKMSKVVNISHSVDDPPKLFFWTVDELFPFMVMIGIGVFTGKLLTMIAVGVVLSKIYGRFLDKASDKYLAHLVYWRFGIGDNKITFIPDSFDREFY